jgi:stage II sporulation protein D
MDNKKKIIGLFWLLFMIVAPVFAQNDLQQIASDYLKNGRYLEALSFYKDIEMNTDKWQDKKTASYYKGLGDIYFEYLENDKEAVLAYLEFVEKFPAAPEIHQVYQNLAKAFLRLGQKEKAKDCYQYLALNFSDYYKNNSLEKELKAYEDGKATVDNTLIYSDFMSSPRIRVLVLQSEDPVIFSSKGVLSLYLDNGTCETIVSPETDMVFSVRDGVLIADKLSAGLAVRLKADSGQNIEVNGLSYRGDIWVSTVDEQIFVINSLDLEEYLYGVIPREISPSWPEQALKTQAVAARTYALYHMIMRKHEIYDVFSTTSSQVYGGKVSEHPSAIRAVDQTKGEVLICNGKLVLALYHANSGGRTEQMGNVWPGGYTYLKSVKDDFSIKRPGYSWDKKLEMAEIEKCFKKFGLDISSIVNIVPVERAESGRIKKLEIMHESGSFFLSGNSFRLMVGPAKIKGSNFEVKKEKEKFSFSGTGYGHGVGMSQWGVNSMAKKGYDYSQILKFYYPEAVISKPSAAGQKKEAE